MPPSTESAKHSGASALGISSAPSKGSATESTTRASILDGLRSPAFGVAVVMVGLAAIVLAIAAGLIHAQAERHAKALVDAQLQRITAMERLAPVVAALSDLQIAQDTQPRSVFYLVTGPAGDRLAGNLRTWPSLGPDAQGWRRLGPRETGNGTAIARIMRLDGYYPLIVGRTIDEYGPPMGVGWGLFAVIAVVTILSSLVAGSATALRTRAQLDQMRATANREVSAYRAAAGYIAHEMRRPLSRAHLALDGGQTTDAIVRARGEVERTLEAVDAMLTITGLSGVTGTPAAPVDLTSIVAEVIELYADCAAVRDVEVNATLAPLCVLGRATELRRLVANLIDNAVKFTAPGTTVAITLEGSATGGVLRVCDQGPGLSAFPKDPGTPFTRGPGTELIDGQGLGLAIAKAISTRHDASLIWRDGTGGGAEVVVAFPPPVCVSPARSSAAVVV